jgi:dipeptidyl aminopeptidase/acylaminoacyl peptidase
LNKNKMGVTGVSRGAIVASMVATMDSSLAALVLISGFYDPEYSLSILEARAPSNPDIADMVKSMKEEMGSDAWRFYQRSALLQVEKIKTPNNDKAVLKKTGSQKLLKLSL